MHKEFTETSQRPFPIPNGPWLMTQTWNHLVFVHWPVPPEELRAHIPDGLEIDLFNGTGWIGFTPFLADRTRIRGLPPVPLMHSFLELNVRVYVTHKGIPGIYFISLDAEKWPAVLGAKIGAFLPYKHASMDMKREEQTIHFRSRRKHRAVRKRAFRSAISPCQTPSFLPEAVWNFFCMNGIAFSRKREDTFFVGISTMTDGAFLIRIF